MDGKKVLGSRPPSNDRDWLLKRSVDLTAGWHRVRIQAHVEGQTLPFLRILDRAERDLLQLGGSSGRIGRYSV